MSVRVSASSQDLRRTTSLPALTAFTQCGWGYFHSIAAANWHYIGGMENAVSAATTWLMIGYNDSGVFQLESSVANTNFASGPAIGRWFFWALTCSGTAATAYWRYAGATSFNTVTATAPAMTPAVLWIGNDNALEWCDASIAHVKVWDAALTAAELQREAQWGEPVRLEKLHAYWPLNAVGDCKPDLSGNNRPLTQTGTLIGGIGQPDVPRAPIVRRRRGIAASVGGGGTTFTQSVGGAITPAGAIVKMTTKLVAGPITPSGTLTKAVARALTGGCTPTGVVVKRPARALGGTITPSGTLTGVKTALLSLGGALAPAGALLKQTLRALTGGVTPAGTVTRSVARPLTGGVTPAGTLTKQDRPQLAGQVGPSGTVAGIKATTKVLTGAVAPAGDVVPVYQPGVPTSPASGTRDRVMGVFKRKGRR